MFKVCLHYYILSTLLLGTFQRVCGICWYVGCRGTSQCLYSHVTGSVAIYVCTYIRTCIHPALSIIVAYCTASILPVICWMKLQLCFMSGTYLASPVFDYESTLLAGHPSSGTSIYVEYLSCHLSNRLKS